jgi:hypothetical protein
MLIPYSQFAALRLRSFLPDAEVSDLAGWEFEDRVWVGEAVGFSEWLRLQEEPDVLRSMALDLAGLPEEAYRWVFQAIDLPVQAVMTADDLRGLLGEPTDVQSFAANRTTYEFRSPGPHPYKVSCTVRHDGGLIYLVVMAPLPGGEL